jgi:hypothetical protein
MDFALKLLGRSPQTQRFIQSHYRPLLRRGKPKKGLIVLEAGKTLLHIEKRALLREALRA